MKKLNRWHWLTELVNQNQFEIGVEVGVASGITSFFLMQNCPSLTTLYAVDIWRPILNSNWVNKNTKRLFIEEAKKYGSRIHVLEGLSWEMAEHIKDNIIDFIFIDADHSYEAVKKDIIAWTPKLKDVGVLCGHDIHLEGVVPALNELIPDWKDTGIDHVWWSYKDEVKI